MFIRCNTDRNTGRHGLLTGVRVPEALIVNFPS